MFSLMGAFSGIVIAFGLVIQGSGDIPTISYLNTSMAVFVISVVLNIIVSFLFSGIYWLLFCKLFNVKKSD
ncbi:MAG: hypothetical protein ABIJ45_09390, partial [Candidatus Zixiibacteriota bacterium]